MPDAAFDDREASGEEDYDLLTYAEAGSRLDQEIATERALLAAITNAAGQTDEVALAACRDRLAALTAARERTNRRAITNDNFESFFGYPPPQKDSKRS